MIVAVAGRVAAVDVATGKELWRNELSGTGIGAVEMLIEGDRVYVVVASGMPLVCLDYATGEERWRSTTSTVGRAVLLSDGPHLFVARNGYLDCFDRDGQRRWSNGLSALGTGPTAVGLPGNVRQADAEGNR